MKLDIFVLLVLIISTVHGAKKGLIFTLKSFLTWFACIVLAFFFCGRVKNALIDHTPLDEWIYGNMTLRFGDTLMKNSLYKAVIGICPGWAKGEISVLKNGIFSFVTSVTMTVISFLLILILAKLLCFALLRLSSRKNHKKAAGLGDRLLGAVFGLGRGIFYVLLIFLIFIPLLSVWSPYMAEHLMPELENSFVAGALYKSHWFLTILKSL